MKIQITIYNDDDTVFATKEALNFESAEENLGKLQRNYEANIDAMNEAKAEMENNLLDKYEE